MAGRSAIQGWGVLRQAQDERFTGLPIPLSKGGGYLCSSQQRADVLVDFLPAVVVVLVLDCGCGVGFYGVRVM